MTPNMPKIHSLKKTDKEKINIQLYFFVIKLKELVIPLLILLLHYIIIFYCLFYIFINCLLMTLIYLHINFFIIVKNSNNKNNTINIATLKNNN